MESIQGLNGKEGQIMDYSVFCKILDSYLVFCYIKEKSCNKIHLNCLIQFDRFFLDFHCWLYYAETIVTTFSVLGKSRRCRKCKNGYCRFGQVLGRDRFFGLVLRQGFPVLRHGSQAAGSFLVATLYFHVATVLASLS